MSRIVSIATAVDAATLAVLAAANTQRHATSDRKLRSAQRRTCHRPNDPRRARQAAAGACPAVNPLRPEEPVQTSESDAVPPSPGEGRGCGGAAGVRRNGSQYREIETSGLADSHTWAGAGLPGGLGGPLLPLPAPPTASSAGAPAVSSRGQQAPPPPRPAACGAGAPTAGREGVPRTPPVPAGPARCQRYITYAMQH